MTIILPIDLLDGVSRMRLSRRRILTWVIGLLATVAVLALVLDQVPAIQDLLLQQAANRILADRRADLLAPDALRVVLCGTGNPLAD